MREEEILAFWRKNNIFKKSEEKAAPKGEFVFYEGPPTANGRPGIHHMEARAFKDIIPRFRTMQGYHVRRKGGWDTHGLPVELQVEKELGLKSKKDIERYGIAAFNKKCKESVWMYVDEWKRFTERIAFWVDLANAYVTYTPRYIESLWSIVARINTRGLLYKDYKVVPWCPRCGTALSSHELAQGYADVDDTSVYVKFAVVGESNTFLLAWTTTPWTLPGNVALAVGEDIEYVKVKKGDEQLILARTRLDDVIDESEIIETIKGDTLVGMEYEPLFPFLKEQLTGEEKEKLKNAYRVYATDFVTTEDGTGIVHTAVMYGADDFALGMKVGLPKQHLVGEDGRFLEGTGFLEGTFVKDADKDIIADLTKRNLLLKEETVRHTYPFCWRCKTPLIYYARDSWYVRMQTLRDTLLEENKKIHWEPEYIKDGRFGQWLAEVKDWAISRERYWGTPLPIWQNESGKVVIIDSIETLKKYTKKSGNTYFCMRHGESESNAKGVISSRVDNPHHLTEKGKREVREAARELKNKNIQMILSSPFVRTKETAEILAETLGLSKDAVVLDERLGEINLGEINGKPTSAYREFAETYEERFVKTPQGGENLIDMKRRHGALLYELENTHANKAVLLIGHEYSAWMLDAVAGGLDASGAIAIRGSADDYIATGEVRELPFIPLPHNEEYELDLHRPFIDTVSLIGEGGEALRRTPEVMDVWFDSGAMPFAQDHYPMENKKWVEGSGYPADYISEAIDQTRGWFYTLHAVGVLMERGHAYKNVISLGHVLDKEGKKMSKSVGNVIDPWNMIEMYGVDALRLWMYTVNQPGDSKNFDEKAVDEIVKKTFNILQNVHSFYALYAPDTPNTNIDPRKSSSVLDQWVIVLCDTLIIDSTKHLEAYRVMEPARALREFILDLSQWYVRRSRDRFKSQEEGEEEDKAYAVATLRHVLLELSKVMAPFTPFFAEWLYREVGGEKPLDVARGKESVHLADWPRAKKAESQKTDSHILEMMKEVRHIVSLALEARASAGIKVRQPIALLKIKKKIDESLLQLIRDEVNVKEIILDEAMENDVWIDTTLTPELKEEGVVRDIIRHIQGMRKEANLTRDDIVILAVDTDKEGERFIRKFYDTIIKTTLLKDVVFRKTGEEVVSIGDYAFHFSLTKD